MSDIFKPIADDPKATTNTNTSYGSPGSSTTPGTTYSGVDSYESGSSGDAGKTVLAGVVGGIASAVGYLVYSRLPDEQKAKLQQQARSLIESRVNELRSRFNV
ncbi:MAG: hypothetical protein GIX03_08680 [Candidatus Eremiobacteraeota bacterium]|nr:hypothetical protein [Candidatus Eremiobacteraeota bacterium]MBC5803055.1 hypothetical protein [Candidatus Eremiobacteraeota bacterium]MBC5821424.1 hypothetical protein [Candidatus Eremiobacteraeota bacterium]